MKTRTGSELERLEMRLLLDAIFHRYGFDFRHYARASLMGRIEACIRDERLTTISGLQEKVLHDELCMDRVFRAFSVVATSLFRDPSLFLKLRTQVFPQLRGERVLRLWVAGCATGEEAYSLAIVLEQEGLYDKTRIYATDISHSALAQAESGVYPLAAVEGRAGNYQRAGGRRPLAQYYTARHGKAIFHPALRKNIVFAQHDLASDSSFNEFSLVLCRNVLIYFNRVLQNRVHQLLYESLGTDSFLAVGNKESLRFTPYESRYNAFDLDDKLYRKLA